MTGYVECTPHAEALARKIAIALQLENHYRAITKALSYAEALFDAAEGNTEIEIEGPNRKEIVELKKKSESIALNSNVIAFSKSSVGMVNKNYLNFVEEAYYAFGQLMEKFGETDRAKALERFLEIADQIVSVAEGRHEIIAGNDSNKVQIDLQTIPLPPSARWASITADTNAALETVMPIIGENNHYRAIQKCMRVMRTVALRSCEAHGLDFYSFAFPNDKHFAVQIEGAAKSEQFILRNAGNTNVLSFRQTVRLSKNDPVMWTMGFSEEEAGLIEPLMPILGESNFGETIRRGILHVAKLASLAETKAEIMLKGPLKHFRIYMDSFKIPTEVFSYQVIYMHFDPMPKDTPENVITDFNYEVLDVPKPGFEPKYGHARPNPV